jgi:hypothetical protein
MGNGPPKIVRNGINKCPSPGPATDIPPTLPSVCLLGHRFPPKLSGGWVVS